MITSFGTFLVLDNTLKGKKSQSTHFIDNIQMHTKISFADP